MTEVSLGRWLQQQLGELILPSTPETPLYLLTPRETITYRCPTPAIFVGKQILIEKELGVATILIENYALDLQLGDRLIANWLETLYQLCLADLNLSDSPRTPFVVTTHLFPLQYSYLRCCAWLRIAQREGIISLKGELVSSYSLVQVMPQLNPVDRQLLESLIRVVDTLFDSQPHNWVKITNALSNAILHFDRDSGIWRAQRRLQEIRIVIVTIAQHYLRTLMESKLQIPVFSDF